jgi:Lon protease-like protein
MSLHPFPLVFSLLVRAGRRAAGRLIGNTRFRLGRGLRFRPTLSAFGCTGLVRCSAGRLTGNARFRSRGGRRFLVRPSLSALSCSWLIRSSGLVHRAVLLHCASLPRGPLLRLGRVRAGLCLGRVRFFRALLFLCWCRLLVWLLRHRGASQRQRTAY